MLAFRCAYKVTADRHYLRRMRESFAWFLGANRLGLPLYDFATGGCRDGMGVAEVNQNQGAESTICFLLSLLKMLELAGEELERDDSGHVAAEIGMTSTRDYAHSPSRSCPTPAACSPSPTFPARKTLLPGQSRAHLLMTRILAIPEAEVAALNAAVLQRFDGRHRRLSADARAAVRGAGASRPRRRRGVCRPPPADRRLLHARVRGRGRGAVQSIDRAGARPERCSRAAHCAS